MRWAASVFFRLLDSHSDAITQGEPGVFWLPFPHPTLARSIGLELQRRPFSGALERPAIAFTGHLVISVEAVIFDTSREVGSGLVDAQYAEGVEASPGDVSSVVLDHEELPRMP